MSTNSISSKVPQAQDQSSLPAAAKPEAQHTSALPTPALPEDTVTLNSKAPKVHAEPTITKTEPGNPKQPAYSSGPDRNR